jgi:hypothetical protein
VHNTCPDCGAVKVTPYEAECGSSFIFQKLVERSPECVLRSKLQRILTLCQRHNQPGVGTSTEELAGRVVKIVEEA